MGRKAIVVRLRVWKEVVWHPWAWVLAAAWLALQFYQSFKGEWLSPEAQEQWRLPNIFPALPWWHWALGWLILCIGVVLEGAYRSVRDRDTAIRARDQTIAAQIAAEPRLGVCPGNGFDGSATRNAITHLAQDRRSRSSQWFAIPRKLAPGHYLDRLLEVVFDPDCGGCFDGSGSTACLGVWNSGPAAEDVHVYLLSVTPGRSLGKLELSWYGEGAHGRRLNTSVRAGHHHVWLLQAGPEEPYSLAAATSWEPPGSPYTVEVMVEGKNIQPVRAGVEVDPSKRHSGVPIRRVSPA